MKTMDEATQRVIAQARARRAKKSSSFEPMNQIKLPPGMNKFMSGLNAPMAEIQNLMNMEDGLDEEDVQNLQARKSLAF